MLINQFNTWFLTSVSTPLSLQSTEEGRDLATVVFQDLVGVAAGGALNPPMWRLSNSAWVRSLNWVTPILQEDPERLCSSYLARFAEKISSRLSYSFLVI